MPLLEVDITCQYEYKTFCIPVGQIARCLSLFNFTLYCTSCLLILTPSFRLTDVIDAHKFAMPFLLNKPADAVGSATPAIAIGLFAAFGGLLFG